jgi:hypothetical protein
MDPWRFDTAALNWSAAARRRSKRKPRIQKSRCWVGINGQGTLDSASTRTMGYKSATMIFGQAKTVAEVRTMLKRLETERGDHPGATAAKNVFESHEPESDGRNLTAQRFRKYERGPETN